MPGPSQSRLRSHRLAAQPSDDPAADRRFYLGDPNGDVVVVDAGGGIVWRGRVTNAGALDAFGIPGSVDGIVMLNWDDDRQKWRSAIRSRTSCA